MTSPITLTLFGRVVNNLLAWSVFNRAEFRIIGKKGEGTFSEVLKVQDIRDGGYFACKKMKQRYER